MVFVIHVVIFIATIFTDTTTSIDFNEIFSLKTDKYDNIGIISPESFELRMYQKLFCYTALVTAVIEGSAGFRAKSMYFSFLEKYGLDDKTYFCYRHLIQLIKAIIYATASAIVFIIIEAQC